MTCRLNVAAMRDKVEGERVTISDQYDKSELSNRRTGSGSSRPRTDEPGRHFRKRPISPIGALIATCSGCWLGSFPAMAEPSIASRHHAPADFNFI